MFKKRTRPTTVREKARPEEDELAADSPGPGIASSSGSVVGDGEDQGSSIDELILLRKLKKQLVQPGINLERLNQGEKKGPGGGATEDKKNFGLQTVWGQGEGNSKGKGKAEEADVNEDERERMKRLVRSNNFTQQTNALDVDKHMLAYIEEELSKRRGNTIREGEEVDKPFDPQEELYRLNKRYILDASQLEEEGSVTNSLGMLTSIPEVDLGIENRLKNIEATERAKREVMEARKAAQVQRKNGKEIEDYAAQRFFQQKNIIASDTYAIEDAKREAANLLIPPPKILKPEGQGPKHESATDEQVYDRFKKRMRR